MSSEPLRVVSVVEGTWVTGPIKPLLMFAKLAKNQGAQGPSVALSLLATARLGPQQTKPGNPLIDSVRAAGVDIDVIHERRAWDPRVVLRIAYTLRARRPHIVETHQVKSHFLLAQALLWGGLPRNFAWIAYHHGYTKANLKLTLYEALDRWTLRRPDHVVTMCEPFASQLVARGANPLRLSVISNATEVPPPPAASELQRLRAQLGLSACTQTILSVGRLSREKGHRHLIEAFASLDSPAESPVHLVIVGDGPERAELLALTANVKDRVHFAGHQQDVWPYYFIADVFALPSLTEGSPLVLFEAMAAGCAIVATRVGGVPETIGHDESGLLVPPSDPVAFKAAMERVLRTPELRRRLAAEASRASQKYSPNQYRERISKLYEKVLAERLTGTRR